MNIEVNIKRFREDAVMPRYATDGAAGMDICCASDTDVVILPGERKLVPCGFGLELKNRDCVILMYARSGLSSKHGITMANGVGVIDSDYRGEIMCPLINLGEKEYTVKKGERIAQIVFAPIARAELTECGELGDTERGANGFGSTGR